MASDTERRWTIEQFWDRRHVSEIERCTRAKERMFAHLREGGWGSQHLSARYMCMHFLSNPDGRVVHSSQIRLRVQMHSAGLFGSPPKDFLDQDAQLNELLKEEQLGNIPTQCTISTEHVRDARWSLKSRKTDGEYTLVAEFARHRDAADWIRAAFNRRIMISADLDPHGVFADPVWCRFGASLLPQANAPMEFKLLRPIAILMASARL